MIGSAPESPMGGWPASDATGYDSWLDNLCRTMKLPSTGIVCLQVADCHVETIKEFGKTVFLTGRPLRDHKSCHYLAALDSAVGSINLDAEVMQELGSGLQGLA